MKLRKILLIVSLSALVGTQMAFAANFSDVPATHTHGTAIQSLKDANIITGYGDGTFQPDKKVSRAEAAAIILRSIGVTAVKTNARMPFADVPESAWYFPTIQKGVAMGKLKGYPDKTFKPEQSVTLPEALELTLKFFQVGISKVGVADVIYDGLDTTAWYAKQAQYAKNNNLIEPNAKGHIDPVVALTRGDLAEIIYRMRSVQATGKPFDITANWITTEHPDNFWKIKHPADWEIFKGLQNSTIWKPAPMQVFFTRVWPESARLSISVVENPNNLTAAQYFANLKNAYIKGYKDVKKMGFTDVTLSGRPAMRISISERRILDLALQLPNKKFLMFYGEYGEAPTGEFFRKQLDAAIMSYQYVETPPTPPKPTIPLEDRMSTLRENILISDKWKDIAPLFPDKKVISTDAIGIGTGPVDYYYSAEAAYTIKLERSSGTVLNIKEGKTDTF
jgi:hypothetical protein